jgi:hypothetical protein
MVKAAKILAPLRDVSAVSLAVEEAVGMMLHIPYPAAK